MFDRMNMAIFRALGVDAIYTPIDDLSIDCRVILEHDSVLQPSSLDTNVVEIGITIDAKYSEIGTPETGGLFTIDGNVYTVKRVEANDKSIVRMWVTEYES